jgi:triphosphoribosyl-dephospho-CoA synthase
MWKAIAAVRAEAIKAAYLAACREEIEAPKPGNVHVFAPGHGMAVEDFNLSAEASVASIVQAGASVGERVLGAVAATRQAVGQNTNLGIVLLCAPLARAAEADQPLRLAVEGALREMRGDDAGKVFQAIALANPGGLGEVKAQDVRQPPTVSLVEAMTLAAGRDRIARAYVNGFADIFDLGLPMLKGAETARRPPWWPATVTYLAFLAAFPDSHIGRKHGDRAARAVRDEARELQAKLREEKTALAHLLAFDASLKARGLNPGTSADFTVATLFAGKLDSILREGAKSG